MPGSAAFPASTSPLSIPHLGAANGGLTLAFEHHGQLLTGHWYGWLAPTVVMQGARAVCRALLHHGCPLVLNDLSATPGGDWSELLPWMQYDYLPRLAATGLRRMACVLPVDPAGRFSLQALMAGAPPVLQVALFETESAARHWLEREGALLAAEPAG